MTQGRKYKICRKISDPSKITGIDRPPGPDEETFEWTGVFIHGKEHGLYSIEDTPIGPAVVPKSTEEVAAIRSARQVAAKKTAALEYMIAKQIRLIALERLAETGLNVAAEKAKTETEIAGVKTKLQTIK